MKRTEELIHLKKMLDDNLISNEEFERLKNETLNENNSTLKSDKINWFGVICLLLILILHFFCFVKWASYAEASEDVLNNSYSASANWTIYYLTTIYGILSFSITIIGIILFLLKIRFVWLAGLIIGGLLLGISTFNVPGFNANFHSTVGGIDASYKLETFYSPAFFYIVFFILLLFISGIPRPKKGTVDQSPLSNRLKIVAGIGIFFSLLKLIQEFLGFYTYSNLGSIDSYTSYYEAMYKMLSCSTDSTYYPGFIKTDIQKSFYVTLSGLAFFGYTVIILLSQIMILLRKRVFVYLYLLPSILVILQIIVFRVIITQDGFVAYGSEYFGYLMDVFWNTNHYSKDLHVFGTILIMVIAPISFFTIYFLERKKMD